MRTVLVTGTSSGFGLLTCITLARRGWRVIATMRDVARRGELEALADAAGVRGAIHIAPLDVTQWEGLPERINALVAQVGGRLDAIVNNAGVAVGAVFEDLPRDDLHRIMNTNFFGQLELTRALLPHFRAARQGRIVFVSSNSAFAGEPANSVYCASKAALEGFAESLAYEIEPFGIQVVLIEPGEYKTSIWRNAPRLRPAGSAYAAMLDILWPAVERHVAAVARDPQEVADTIARALEARRPRFRYPVGPSARMGLLLRGVVPAKAMRWMVWRYLGLHRARL